MSTSPPTTGMASSTCSTASPPIRPTPRPGRARHTAALAIIGTVNTVHQPYDPVPSANSSTIRAPAPKITRSTLTGFSMIQRKGSPKRRAAGAGAVSGAGG